MTVLPSTTVAAACRSVEERAGLSRAAEFNVISRIGSPGSVEDARLYEQRQFAVHRSYELVINELQNDEFRRIGDHDYIRFRDAGADKPQIGRTPCGVTVSGSKSLRFDAMYSGRSNV
ncbi:hypothetical protein GCM10007977_059950 [Dactylosporangium sucinum]|uniref:Uncharacterized protein n=1 Tax=Dactylosporangium sucinum TaxID=1424081 RepID=A0A917U0V5_9ACTN|nr:hypothetical protein GCM10007977_059950 [Dactylosporangium sucinum]